ncbi:MAG: LON peptidase substrate-binding domain-containing protein [Actinobacteria bacterium]|nr:LON peptidase substrate-binding domain-containing protein [Actinomycetota bacterium]
MFPLGSVLLPGGILTLHVFEPRYQALVRACIDTEDHEFGTVLIERGSEVGGGDVRRDMGTVARMVQVAELDGGRFAVVAVGTHRMMVRSWLPDDPYPVADVDEVPDVEREPDRVDALLRELTPRVRRATALAMELGDPVADPQQDLSDDPLIASYQLSALAPLGDVDRFDLLMAAGPSARLELLRDRLGDVETLLRFRLDAG